MRKQSTLALLVCGPSVTFGYLAPTAIRNGFRRCSCVQRRVHSEQDLADADALVVSSAPITRFSFLATLASATATSFPIVAVAAASPTSVDSAATTAADSRETLAIPPRENARRESISGFAAGAALTLTKTVVKYPLDTATVRLQMPNTAYSIRNLPALFSDAYVGITVPLVTNIPAGAVFFAVKDAVKTSLTDSTQCNSLTKTLVSVAAAQIPYWLLRNPTEVVKTRQQAGQAKYNATSLGGILQAYQQVRVDALEERGHCTNTSSDNGMLPPPPLSGFKNGGWDAYYTGYWENVAYAYPADVVKFACYEWLSQGQAHLPPSTGALYGALATAVAQCVTTPLDVIRNRVMASEGMIVGPNGTTSAKPLSYTECLVELARQEGLGGLFAGVTPRVGKAILSGAIQFATYEETKQEIAKLFAR
jgi:solute carrier family 25 (mitochondrial S-adenosylmethionine transporter), member 26